MTSQLPGQSIEPDMAKTTGTIPGWLVTMIMGPSIMSFVLFRRLFYIECIVMKDLNSLLISHVIMGPMK